MSLKKSSGNSPCEGLCLDAHGITVHSIKTRKRNSSIYQAMSGQTNVVHLPSGEVHSNRKLENFGGVLIEARGLGGSFSWERVCLAYRRRWFGSQHCLKQA